MRARHDSEAALPALIQSFDDPMLVPRDERIWAVNEFPFHPPASTP
jgi:hypothetical protein